MNEDDTELFRDKIIEHKINRSICDIGDYFALKFSNQLIADEENNTGYYVDLVLGKYKKLDYEELKKLNSNLINMRNK